MQKGKCRVDAECILHGGTLCAESGPMALPDGLTAAMPRSTPTIFAYLLMEQMAALRYMQPVRVRNHPRSHSYPHRSSRPQTRQTP